MGLSLTIMFLRVSLNASIATCGLAWVSPVSQVFKLPSFAFFFALPVVSQMLDTGLPISRHSWR